MVGVPGTAERLFAALHGANVSVTMISQGSSEHSICCVVRADQAERGRAAIAAAFSADTATGSPQAVSITPEICVLAAVGDGMEIGIASCRERVCTDVKISVVAG